MKDELNKLDGKVDKIDDKLGIVVVEIAKQSIILERNTNHLEEHMARTEKLEVEQTEFRNYIKGFHRGAKWVLGGLVTAAGLVLGVLRVLN